MGSPHTTAALGDGAYTFRVQGRRCARQPGSEPGDPDLGLDRRRRRPEDTVDRLRPLGPDQHITTLRSRSTRPRPARASSARSTQALPPWHGRPHAQSPYAPGAPLSDGARTFRVRSTDAAGNQDASPADARLHGRHDGTRHRPSPTSGARGAADSTPTFTSTRRRRKDATFQCSVDPGTPSFGACSGPRGLQPHGRRTWPSGSYVFRVRAADEAPRPRMPPRQPRRSRST